jgi:hypothetical protein
MARFGEWERIEPSQCSRHNPLTCLLLVPRTWKGRAGARDRLAEQAGTDGRRSRRAPARPVRPPDPAAVQAGSNPACATRRRGQRAHPRRAAPRTAGPPDDRFGGWRLHRRPVRDVGSERTPRRRPWRPEASGAATTSRSGAAGQPAASLNRWRKPSSRPAGASRRLPRDEDRWNAELGGALVGSDHGLIAGRSDHRASASRTTGPHPPWCRSRSSEPMWSSVRRGGRAPTGWIAPVRRTTRSADRFAVRLWGTEPPVDPDRPCSRHRDPGRRAAPGPRV